MNTKQKDFSKGKLYKIRPKSPIEKFAKDLKKYCVRNGMDKVINKVKKINGKNRQCWFGMKPFSYNPEMEVEEEEDIEIVD